MEVWMWGLYVPIGFTGNKIIFMFFFAFSVRGNYIKKGTNISNKLLWIVAE